MAISAIDSSVAPPTAASAIHGQRQFWKYVSTATASDVVGRSYELYRYLSGRDDFLDETWGRDLEVDYRKYVGAANSP